MMNEEIPDEIVNKLGYRLNPETVIKSTLWKKYRNPEAQRQFPVGTDIQCGQSWAREPDYDNFFRVRKITPTGIIVTDKLVLEEVARKLDQGGGWIDYDPISATLTDEEIRFYPDLWSYDFVVVPYDKATNTSAVWGHVNYIVWSGTSRSGYHRISRLEPKDDGLVRAIMGSVL